MRTSPIFFYRSRGPTSSRRWGPPPAFGAQGCRSLGSRACERITLNAKIAKRAKHLFERFFLCGLSGFCVDVISSHPLKACATSPLERHSHAQTRIREDAGSRRRSAIVSGVHRPKRLGSVGTRRSESRAPLPRRLASRRANPHALQPRNRRTAQRRLARVLAVRRTARRATAFFSSAACLIRYADQTQRTQRETNWSCLGVLRVLCVDSAPLHGIETRASAERRRSQAPNRRAPRHGRRSRSQTTPTRVEARID